MLALARLYLTVDDLDSCQQQCVQLLKMDSENDAATVVSTFNDVPCAFIFPGSVFLRMAIESIQQLTTSASEIAISTSLVIQSKNLSPVKYSPFLLNSRGRSRSRSRSRSR